MDAILKKIDDYYNITELPFQIKSTGYGKMYFKVGLYAKDFDDITDGLKWLCDKYLQIINKTDKG